MKLRLLAAVSSVALLTSACGGGDAKDEDAAKGTSEPIVQVAPLTGQVLEDGLPDNPVFVVKVENTVAGAPQYGLAQADMVVEQLVEGGVTRLAALYHSDLPEAIGHVRSMRATDVGIAAPVAGNIVASGGAPQTYPVVEDAGLAVYTEDHGAPGFSSDPNKSRPYNRMLDLAALAGSASAGDIPGPYLEFTKEPNDDEDSAVPEGARDVTSASVTFSPQHTTNWTFADGLWIRTNSLAAANEDFQATTVVVVFAPVQSAGYLDPGGNFVPETVFEGSGPGMVLQAGQAVDVTWTKDGAAGTLKFTDAAGQPVTVNPGKVFIELAPEAGSVSAQ